MTPERIALIKADIPKLRKMGMDATAGWFEECLAEIERLIPMEKSALGYKADAIRINAELTRLETQAQGHGAGEQLKEAVEKAIKALEQAKAALGWKVPIAVMKHAFGMCDEALQSLRTHPVPGKAQGVCPECGGIGQIQKYAGGGRHHDPEDCSTCQGTGQEPAEAPSNSLSITPDILAPMPEAEAEGRPKLTREEIERYRSSLKVRAMLADLPYKLHYQEKKNIDVLCDMALAHLESKLAEGGTDAKIGK